MKKKAIFTVLGTITLLLCAFAVVIFIRNGSPPEDPVEEAMRSLAIYTEEGFILTLSEDGSYYTLEIKTVPKETELVIPSYHNGIPIKSFYTSPEALNNIEHLSIPATLEQIGIYPSGIDNLKLNEYQNGYYLGIEDNPYHALIDYSLDISGRAVVHKDTKIINNSAFSKCKQVISVILPDGLRSIGHSAFSQCTALTHIEIPDSVTFVGDSIFKKCESLESAVVGAGLTEIAYGMFNHCSALKSIEIKGKITAIRDHAFNGCSSLTSFEIPHSVTEIGSFAFTTSLKNVTMHKGIRDLSPYAFSEVTETLNYNEYRGGLYLGDSENPYLYLINLADEEPLDLVLHPDTYYVANYLVSKTKSLKSLSVEGGNGRYLRSEGNCIIRKEDKALLCGIGTSIIPSKGVQEICDYAFFKSDIESIIIPDSVKKIGYGAFGECRSLTSIEIGKNVQVLGDSVFYLCTKLEKISLPKSLIKIPDHCFSNCYLLYEVTVAEQTEIIGDSAFQSCIALQSISLPGVKVIEARAFTGCKMLENVTLSANLEFIGDYAFHHLEMLEKIILPYGLRHIGEEVFSLCGSIKYVNIPKSVESFGERVFLGCTSLETAIIPDVVKELAICEFQECRNLKTIYLPSTLKKINTDTLWKCDSIEQLHFDGTVAEWNAIEKSEKWYRDVPPFKVICTDGEIEHPGDGSEYVNGDW